jgi:hypothetical protein
MTTRIALLPVALGFGLLLAASSAAEDKLTRIGLLTRMLPNASLKEAFQQGLRDLGYVEGKNIVVEWRNAVSSDDLPPLGGIFFIGQGAKIAQDVRASKRPAIFPYREYHEFGVLMSYGADLKGVFRRAAYYVDKILKGAKPAELPVEQISKFDLVIDLRVAREQGIKVPQEVLFRADEVIR